MKYLLEEAQQLQEGSARQLAKDLLDLKATLNDMDQSDWNWVSEWAGTSQATGDILDDKVMAVNSWLRKIL